MKKIFIILMAAMVAAGSVYAADNSKKTAKSNKAYNMSSMPTLGAVDNLVLAYQAQCAEGQGIRLDYFVGGQIKGGYLGGGAGVIGFGAAAGIEAKMKNAPIAFSFDFRPGYGCILGNFGMGGVGAFHTFDWTMNLGVRYTF